MMVIRRRHLYRGTDWYLSRLKIRTLSSKIRSYKKDIYIKISAYGAETKHLFNVTLRK